MKQFYKHFTRIFFILLFFCFQFVSPAQYVLNGSATQNNCNCYTLTQAQNWQGGSVWNANKINLNNSFDFTFNVFTGCEDINGADGIVFILQPISTSLGTGGGGMGFEGISPSIGIALDTWQNTNNNDPTFDHISIQANGNITHGTDLAGPVQASVINSNIEDCQWHLLRIEWNATTKILNVYFDGQFRLAITNDLVANIFNNDPFVFWGFAGATGGSNNLQQFCTALNPGFNSGITNNSTCLGTPVTFSDTSVSFAPVQSWYWNFGDGNTSCLQNPPPHLYALPGIYEVKLVITGLDGCISDTLKKNITIGSKPNANFEVFDTCSGQSPRIIELSTNRVGTINQWTWLMDGSIISTAQQPVLGNISSGNHILQLFVTTAYGCRSDTMTRPFFIKPKPVITAIANDGCQNDPVQFNAVQLDNSTTILNWIWDFGNGVTSTMQNPVQSFSVSGWAIFSLTAQALNGCSSAVVDTIRIEEIYAIAMNDTLVIPNSNITLRVSYGGNFNGPTALWSPATGLNNPNAILPVANIQNDITYTVTLTSEAGCTATDAVTIKIFKGASVYVPTGFTPNGDGRNDLLRPIYLGIAKVYYFRIYNRWGQLVFSSAQPGEGWDGKIGGVSQPAGTYVWMLKAEDLSGKQYNLKGTSTIIR